MIRVQMPLASGGGGGGGDGSGSGNQDDDYDEMEAPAARRSGASTQEVREKCVKLGATLLCFISIALTRIQIGG